MKKLLTIGTAAAFATAGIAGAGPALAGQHTPPASEAKSSKPAQAKPTSPGYQPPPIAWSTCTNTRLKAAGAQCGFVSVPLDYANPKGTKIKLAVSRIKHKTSDAKSQGIMLVNPVVVPVVRV